MELREKVKLVEDIENSECVESFFRVDSNEGELIVSSTNCPCMSHMSMTLPYRHIFAVRMKLDMDLFAENLCDNRWTNQYYRENQLIFQEDNYCDSQPADSAIVCELPVSQKRPKSQV